MAHDPMKIYMRHGNRSDLPATRTAGQLLFATYDDAVQTANGQVTLKQGDVYLDLSDGANGVRVNLANDVDKARSLYSGRTRSDDPIGQWHIEDMEGVSQIYDGLTIAV